MNARHAYILQSDLYTAIQPTYIQVANPPPAHLIAMPLTPIRIPKIALIARLVTANTHVSEPPAHDPKRASNAARQTHSPTNINDNNDTPGTKNKLTYSSRPLPPLLSPSTSPSVSPTTVSPNLSNLLAPSVSPPQLRSLSDRAYSSVFISSTCSCSLRTSSTAVSNSTLGFVAWTFLSQPSASKSQSARTCSHSCVVSSSSSPRLRL